MIFGGERDAGVLDDLWTLKGADGSEPAKWTQIKLRPAPAARFGHAIAGGMPTARTWARHLCDWLRNFGRRPMACSLTVCALEGALYIKVLRCGGRVAECSVGLGWPTVRYCSAHIALRSAAYLIPVLTDVTPFPCHCATLSTYGAVRQRAAAGWPCTAAAWTSPRCCPSAATTCSATSCGCWTWPRSGVRIVPYGTVVRHHHVATLTLLRDVRRSAPCPNPSPTCMPYACPGAVPDHPRLTCTAAYRRTAPTTLPYTVPY